MTSIAQALQQAALLDSDTAMLDTELILCHVLDRDRSYLRTWPEKELTLSQQASFDELIDRRRAGEPVAYLIGQQAFWTLDLLVSPDTLIPRADTELLVETALVLPIPSRAKVIDLGTGTGAIALALASEHSDWNVTGVDCADEVIALAQKNAERNHLSHVGFLKSHWFDAVGSQRFDLIVSNPPYIDEDDHHLDQGDVRFEPKSALVADNQGMADIEFIAREAKGYMNKGAWLMFEHGYDQGQKVRECLQGLGYTEVQTKKDLGQNDRITFGKYDHENQS